MLCTDLTGVKTYDDHIIAEPLWCNAWNCDLCAPRRKAKLIAQVLDGHPTVLLTLTVSDDVPGSQNDRARALSHAWRALRRLIRIELALPSPLRWLQEPALARAPALATARQVAMQRARKAPADLAFFAVFERTKRGAPHLHIALRPPFIPQAWISDQMQALLRSPIVDIRQVNQQRGLARYLGKYIGKDAHKFGNSKRYWHSKDYLLNSKVLVPTETQAPHVFAIVRENWNEYAHNAMRQGCRYELSENSITIWPKQGRSSVLGQQEPRHRGRDL